MIKTLVVYSHLLATCMALGSVLLMDLRIWLWRNQKPDQTKLASMAETQTIATFSLYALWLTGALLLYVGYANDGIHYLMNEKIWAKVSVVSLLTINGILLHRIAFPVLQKAALREQVRKALIGISLLGAISTTSWLFAAFLGIARPWSYALPYSQIMGIYLSILGLACAFAIIISLWLSRSSSKPSQMEANPRYL